MGYEARLVRSSFYEKRIIGNFELFKDNKSIFKCFTCEDIERPIKVKGETAIARGTYVCKMTYSPRFKKNMWQVMNVPNFEGIRIHAGNTEKDTEGCILLGLEKSETGISKSRDAIAIFENLLKDCKEFKLTIG